MEKVLKRIIFDLSIKLPNLEIKEPNVNIQDFLDIDDKMAESLKDVFKVSEHLNLFEKFVDELIIKGEINGMVDTFNFREDAEWFNVEVFTESLKKVPKVFNCETEWNGYIEIITPSYENVYRSPEFIFKSTPYWFTRAGRNDHEGFKHMIESAEREKRNYEEGNTNEDGDWVNY